MSSNTSKRLLSISPAVINYYTYLFEESNRLAEDHCIERLRTLDILNRFVPSNSVVLDVGGGTGVYAFPLAKQGHQVHLVDPVELHIQLTLEASKKQSCALSSCQIGDARDLNMFSTNFARVVLMLGPLYHLQEASDRAMALAESFRICEPGGVVIVAGISRFAPFCDGMKNDLLKDPAFIEIFRNSLKTGKHVNNTENLNYFTDAYLHRPEELKLEVESAGFKNVRVVAVEGPSWLATDELKLKNSSYFEEVMSTLRTIEEEPSLIGASSHFVVIGSKV